MTAAALELIAMADRDKHLPIVTPSTPISAVAAPQLDAPLAAANDRRVKGFVFDLTYSYGVGGGVYPDYDPVVLFADGMACECLEQAVEDIDIDKVRREQPKKVGRWRQSGGDYVIGWGGGRKQKTVKGSVIPPQIVPASSGLQGTYQSVGGDVLTAAVKDLTFFGDGSFEPDSRIMKAGNGKHYEQA